LDLLMRRWERARAGQGQFALIVGEPGLGKSRLIEELHGRLAETPHTWVEWSASQLLQNTPLHPITEWGWLRFGGSDVTAEQRLAALEKTLRLLKIDADQAAPLLAPLLDIPLPPDRQVSLAPDEMRQQQLAAIISCAIAGARVQPIVLAFEDLQWADPTSIEVLRALAERCSQASLLILATTRPEFRLPWGLRSHHSVISLAPLDRAQVVRMVTELALRRTLSKEVIEDVSERTGGVPLFVEEVTLLLLERGEQGRTHAIPPTLQQSLAARLDRLGSAREAAQIGAVLGSDFSYSLLRNVAEMDEPALQGALERLVEADVLIVEGAPPEAAFRFKHALIRDVAYDSLLKSGRQGLHRRAAEILREIPERAAAEPEVIAHHFTEARLDDLAIEWWGKAGDQALRRSAFQEAIAHLGKAIEMADKAVATTAAATTPEAKSSRRVRLQTDYAQAVLWSKGFAAEETKAAFERTGDLATRADLPAERFPALYGQCVWILFRGEVQAARNIAERFLREAEAEERIAEVGVAHRLIGLCCTLHGELAAARTHLELALNSYDRDRDCEVREKFGQDTGVASRAFLALASWHLGDLRRARQLIDEAIRLGHELGHLPSAGTALLYKMIIETARNDPEKVIADAENLLSVSQQHYIEWYVVFCHMYLSWARGRLGDARRSADELRESLAVFTSQGNGLGTAAFLGLLAELEAAAGDVERGLALIDEGLAAAKMSGAHISDALLYRLRGDMLLKRNPVDSASAEEAYRTAIDVAKRQRARSHELLASFSLAKLYQSNARRLDAQAILAPALEGFSPTPEMPEIAEAQALLAAFA
jgi:tetratricopeptide (TPR) repeat protein